MDELPPSIVLCKMLVDRVAKRNTQQTLTPAQKCKVCTGLYRFTLKFEWSPQLENNLKKKNLSETDASGVQSTGNRGRDGDPDGGQWFRFCKKKETPFLERGLASPLPTETACFSRWEQHASVGRQ